MISGNNGILTKATDAKKANEKGTDGDRVRLAAQAALIDGEGVINTNATSGKGSLYAALVEEFGSETVSGNYANGTITLNEKSYTVTTTGGVTVSDASSSGSGAVVAKQWTWTDSDEDGVKSIGDLITSKKKTTEQFYVIGFSENNTKVKLLAKYGLNSSGIQDSGYNYRVFCSDTTWQNANVELGDNLNENQQLLSDENTVPGMAKKYGDQFDNTIGRLMTNEEAISFCDADVQDWGTVYTVKAQYQFMTTCGQFWLADVDPTQNMVIRTVYGSNLTCLPISLDEACIRPVIEIPAISIDQM